MIELCSRIDASTDRACVEAERRELARHGGGCHQKIGVTVLRRDYGTIEFIRGLTDAGEVLNSMQLTSTRATWPKPHRPDEVFTGGGPGTRVEVLHQAVSTVALESPSAIRGLFVARAEAWPQNETSTAGEGALARDSYLWTAGLSTWRKLAARGIWVHGSSEGLGEDDDTRLEILAGQPIEWLRLTHQEAPIVGRTSKTLATYRVESEPPSFEILSRAKFFYWKSGTQFMAALAVCPAIVNGYHATGPGHTSAAVRRGLLVAGVPEAEILRRHAVFLGEAEFHKFLRTN